MKYFPSLRKSREPGDLSIHFRAKITSSDILWTNRKIRGNVNSSCVAQLGKKMQGSWLNYLKGLSAENQRKRMDEITAQNSTH